MSVSRTICLGFLAVILFGTVLLMLPISTSSGQWNDFIIALFTSTSAVCVTGHIVVDTATYFSGWGQFFIAVLIQVGGLGYMTATTFLLLILGRRFGLRDKMALQQALDRPGMQGLAPMIRSIIATALVFELTGVFLLMLVFAPEQGLDRGVGLALFHSISAWNNAGFSLFSDNLISYQGSWLVNGVITGLIIMGGIGYEVIFESYLLLRDRLLGKKERFVLSLNFKVVVSTTALLLVGGAIAIFLTEIPNSKTLGALPFETQLLTAWFQSVTARTAGFNTIDIGSMTKASLFITIALMFIGGSPGGTAGGIKTTTIRVLTSCTKAILHGKEEVHLYERQLSTSVILKSVGVTVGSAAVVVVMTIAIAISDPQIDFIRIFFEVVSGFATVGLSTGITAELSSWGKLILVLTMFIGRVGVLLLMSAILSTPRPTSIRYPEENLLVG
jgi:trk system potassium uptake protein TrkH